MSQNLAALGFTVVPFDHGFKAMSAPSWEVMKLAPGGRIQHGGNKVPAWIADNIHTRTDFVGNIKPSDQKSAEKITASLHYSLPSIRPFLMATPSPRTRCMTNRAYWRFREPR